jgi:hypothetical protein
VILECPDHEGPLPPSEQRIALLYGDFGLRVVPRQRAILVWHWPTKEYVPAGYEQVLVVT